jgi:arabinogalactan endo-1,4-beta-galactosidase
MTVYRTGRTTKLAAFLAAVTLFAVLPAPAASAANVLTVLGADVSTAQRALDSGAKYSDANGTAGDPLDILKGAGVNYVRLRVWNNPRSGYNNKAKVLQYARSVRAKGLKLLVDFHYSDTWADPGKQTKPAAWASHGIGTLQTDVYDYTYDVCSALKAQGTAPDSVQIGNEINTGMLWNDGKVVNNDFANLGLLLKAGYNATKACNGATGVVSDLRSRYGKPVVLAETAYPYTTADHDGTPNVISAAQPCAGYPATPAGQAANFTAVQNTARTAGAIGVFYWEPTWYAVPGNGWDPADIDHSGNAWESQAVFDRNGRLNANVRWSP